MTRLGWLHSPGVMRARLPELVRFADEVRQDGIRSVVLCGMGGSSLAAEVFSRTFGPAEGYPELLVLDTTDPRAIRTVEDWADPRTTLFVVASKSGTTLETDCLRRHFLGRLADLGVERPAAHIAVVTDPGSELVALAESEGYRACFENPPDIGGRYSALSFFGLVPAALLGLDLDRLLREAELEAARCAPGVPGTPDAAVLGAAMGALARAGADKLTLRCSQSLRPFSMWVEQLVAESTGKLGRDGPAGVVPVVDEGPDAPLGEDRFVLVLGMEGEDVPGEIPDDVPRGTLTLLDPYEVGGLFFRFEMATALCGVLLGINPFDQPDVASAKRASAEVLARPASDEGPAADAAGSGGESSGEWLAEFLAPVQEGDYVAYLLYLPPEPGLSEALSDLLAATGRRTGAATTVGFGPRYLHSTGQLHKGGPDRGVFVVLEGPDPTAAGVDLPVPGRPYTFGRVYRAQAEGDFRALSDRGRRCVWVRLDEPLIESIQGLAAALRAD